MVVAERMCGGEVMVVHGVVLWTYGDSVGGGRMVLHAPMIFVVVYFLPVFRELFIMLFIIFIVGFQYILALLKFFLSMYNRSLSDLK